MIEPVLGQCSTCGGQFSDCRGRLCLVSEAYTFDLEAVSALKLASSWGLLRQLGRKRFLLTGEFTLTSSDMTRLIEAAGGEVDLWASIPGGTVDIVVAGASPNEHVLRLVQHYNIEVWDEARLVLNLVPLMTTLLAKPGEVPF